VHIWCTLHTNRIKKRFLLFNNLQPEHNFHLDTSFARCVVTMFLGGSYHDRDNPHSNKASHDGKPVVWMILVWNRKEGGDSRAATGGLRTRTGDDLTRMMMMMMMIFYGGTGTKCTEHKIVTRNTDRNNDDGQQRKNKADSINTTTNKNNTTDMTTVKTTPGRARCDTVRRVHREKTKDARNDDRRCMRKMTKTTVKRRKKKDDEDDHAGCATLLETSDGHGDDLHQGRMEDDEDDGTPRMSATGTLDRKTGKATPMRQSATGTLDRKTDQAPPTTCFQPSTPTNETRPTNPDKKCRGHDEDATDGGRTTMRRTAARRGTYWMTTDKWTPWYCNQGEAQITFSSLGPSGWRGSVSTRGCDL
jgi:hypothetical protein